MDHRQIESKLTEAYALGHVGADALADQRQKIQKALMDTLEHTKGIGPSRKELFLQCFAQRLRESGIE